MCIEKDCHLRRLQLSRSRESGGITVTIIFKGLLSWCSGEESASQCRRHKRHGFDSWVRKIPWRRKWQPPRIFLLGKSHAQRSLGGCNPWGRKESDMAEQACKRQKYIAQCSSYGRALYFKRKQNLHPTFYCLTL